jgi:tetratricopeptide (TPR) repeat protein
MSRVAAVRSLVLLAAVFTIFSPTVLSSDDDESPPKLLGAIAVSELEREPYAEWYVREHDAYVPRTETLAALRESSLPTYELTVFFGTWCGDSRREVPRLVKLLERLELPADRLTLVAVDNEVQAHKRSPGGEERGREIYRVPTIIVSRDGREVTRIVEHPSRSLERDLLAIVEGADYRPSYASYPLVRGWLAEGVLSDPNVSARGLADDLRHVVATEGELGAAARVMRTRGQLDEAAKLYETNCGLYPESIACRTALAETLLDAGRPDEAREAAERALRLDPDREQVEVLLELMEASRATAP